MFKITMEVDAAPGAVWRMPRGNLVNSLVRSFVRTCIQTAGQSRRVAAARAAARAVAARTTAASSATSSVTSSATSGPVSARHANARPPVAAAMPRPVAVTARATAIAPGSALALEPAFARVSSRRGAQPATLNPVRIYSTPSRTVMVGNLSEVARFLDDSIERERARLATRIQTGHIQAASI